MAVTTAANDQQVLTTVGAYEIQTRSIRRLIHGLELDTTVIDGYMSLLQGRSTSRRVKCMGSCFSDDFLIQAAGTSIIQVTQ